jgi:hypothetical protein
MQLSRVIPKLARAGSIAAAILIVLTVAWVILLLYPPAPASDASAVERLAFIEQHSQWQLASFAVAILMAIALVPVWLAMAAAIVPRRQTTGLIAGALGILYGPLMVVGYWTQFTAVRSLDNLRESNPEAAIAVVSAFNFSGNFWSTSYGIIIAGFVIWGLATLTIAAGLIDSRHGIARTSALLYGFAGILALLGSLGFAAGVSILEHGILLSGIVFIPALVSTAMLLNRLAAGADVNPTHGVPQPSGEPVLQ